jgi:hypothetical protein
MPNPEDIENPLWNDPRGLKWNEFFWNGPLATPLSSPPQTKTKKPKTMAKKPFLPGSDADKPGWLDNFVLKLKDASNGYAIKYHAPAATITLLDNGRQWVAAVVDALAAARTASQSLTAFKNQLFTGSGAITPPVAPVFTFPDPATVALAAGVITLAVSLGVQIKDSINYAVADGEDMGLEGAAIVPAPAGSISPDLSKSRIASGGLVEIVWKKGRYAGIKILVDRGDGKGEVFLAIDTEPNYIDTVKPAAGATAVYTYRAIYLMGDEEFGQWSQPFEITVRG